MAPANWMATQSRGHVKSRPSIDVQRLHILARCGMTATKCAKSNGWAHVAHEKALCGCAPAGPPPGDSGKCQTEGTARRWSAKGEQTFADQCRRSALGRKRQFTCPPANDHSWRDLARHVSTNNSGGGGLTLHNTENCSSPSKLRAEFLVHRVPDPGLELAFRLDNHRCGHIAGYLAGLLDLDNGLALGRYRRGQVR